MKKIILTFVLFFVFLPGFVGAQGQQAQDEIFKAEVLEVIEERQIETEPGRVEKQQNLKLRGLEGEQRGKIIYLEGIHDFQVTNKNIYKEGDKILVAQTANPEGNNNYYIVDYVRTSKLIWLAAIFVLSVVVVGRWKGMKSLIALAISFIVILKFIVPQILAGANPLLIGIIGSIIILLFAIYLTQGINRKAHLINISLFFPLLLTGILSFVFS